MRADEPFDKNGAAEYRQPQAHKVGRVVIEADDVRHEQHGARHHSDSHLRDHVQHIPTMQRVVPSPRGAYTLHHRNRDDRAR